MIREATYDDALAAYAILEDSYAHTGPRDLAPLDTRTATHVLCGCIDAGTLLVACEGHELDGIAGFAVIAFPWNVNVKSAVEVCWAVRKELVGTMEGNKLMVKLADAMIAKAKEYGAQVFTLGGNVRYPSVMKMLERRHGLTQREVICMGRI